MTKADICRRGTAAALLLLASRGTAQGGPPYVTDDAEPAPYGHVEVYLFSEGAVASGHFGEMESGIEINVGALPNLQVSAALPLVHNGDVQPALGEPNLGAKFRFVQEDADGIRPQIAFYPQVDFAIGADAHEGTHTLLPLWLQKSIGDWTAFGGGGYRINAGPNLINSWMGGAALTRALSENFTMGVEIYGETADSRGEDGIIGLGLGATRDLNENFSILASAGPVFHGRDTDNAYFIALGWHR